MAMRLLEKSDLAKAQANDKKREMDEGLKLTRRVDSLRVLLAKEEDTLNTFRHETLSAIAQESSKAQAEKESLLSEVRLLRLEKEKGLAEVERRTQELNSSVVRLDEFDKKLQLDAQKLQIKHMEADATLKEIKDELLRAQTRKEEAERLHEEADSKHKKAVLTLENAKLIEVGALEDKVRLEAYLANREGLVDQREKELLVKEKDLAEREKANTTLKRQLEDRIATMERNIKRNG